MLRPPHIQNRVKTVLRRWCLEPRTISSEEVDKGTGMATGVSGSEAANSLTVWTCFYVSLITAVVTIVIMAVIYHQYFAVKIVAVDVKGYIQEQQDLYVAGKINDAQLNANLDKMEALVLSLRDSKSDNIVVMTADVFLSKNVKVIRP